MSVGETAKREVNGVIPGQGEAKEGLMNQITGQPDPTNDMLTGVG